MSGNKLAILVLVAALLTTVAQAVLYGGQLPDVVASHFGANGQADGSMSRTGFLGLMLGLQFGMALMMVGFGFAMKKLPPSLINIPNKEYWLHEDRAADTFAFNQTMLNWITAATAVLLVITFQLAIQANLANPLNDERSLNLTVFIASMVVYLVVVFGLCFRMMSRFSKVPAAQTT